MAHRIPYHKPKGTPDAARVYRSQESRKADNRFYASAAWIRLRDAYRAEHPVCEKCGRALTQHVHHVKPRKTHPELALDWGNLQSLCVSCHNACEIR